MFPNWYRSWPSDSDFAENELDKVPHVVDNLPKLVMSRQNYKTVGEYRSLGTNDGWPNDTPGFCMLEWDIALDTQGQRSFAALATLEPREILVAPYRWHDSWINFVGNDGRGPTPDSRPVNVTDARCDSFGLGCIYIPRAILTEFLDGMTHLGFTDYTFGQWYRERYGQARVTWDVHPQHVHDYSDTYG
jgi:hypothetical protein